MESVKYFYEGTKLSMAQIIELLKSFPMLHTPYFPLNAIKRYLCVLYRAQVHPVPLGERQCIERYLQARTMFLQTRTSNALIRIHVPTRTYQPNIHARAPSQTHTETHA